MTALPSVGVRWQGVCILPIAIGANSSALSAPIANPTEAVVFHVAADGDDSASGAANAPFATLERAREALAAAKEGPLPAGDMVVEVRGGLYSLPTAFALVKRDGGSASRRVIYRAAAGEHPVLLAGQRVAGFEAMAEDSGVFVCELVAHGLAGVRLRALFRPHADGSVERLPPAQPAGDRVPPSPKDLVAPGSWAYDPAKSRLFVRAPKGVRSATDLVVLIPQNRSLLSLSRGADRIEIRGLTLRGAGGTAIVLNGVNDCMIAACTIEECGDQWGTGIGIVKGERNVVTGCRISRIGGHGIVIDGGDEARPGRNRAEHNSVAQPGLIDTAAAGIAVTGHGNVIRGNTLEACPPPGLVVKGEGHQVEENDVRLLNQAENKKDKSPQ